MFKETKVNIRSQRILVIALLCLELTYLIWRLFFTFNPQYLIFSVLFYVADLIIGFDAIGFALSLWGLKKKEQDAPLPQQNLNVDVWITTYNESIDILRRTIYHCVNMDYPHLTYVLDDGNRPEVKELTLSLGARYIYREKNTHAKAGNMNNALKLTNGDYIAIFDADFIPQQNFLTELLGYFNDPQMALVQTPQQYYNLNSFQHRKRGIGKELWNEQITFFELVLSGRNHWNAASWIGTNAILRRTAVESVGGFAIESVTEDMLTSMRIHAKGWKTQYVRKYLAFGLAPANLPQFLTQRLRWSQGLAQILRSSNPFTMKGLTFPQRFFYFSSIMHFFEGTAKFFYYLMPSLFLLTGIVPVRFGFDVLTIIIIHPFFNILTIKLVSKGKTSLFNHEIFAMSRFFTYFLGNFMAVIRKKIQFKVTPKQDNESFSLFYALGPGVILGINMYFFLTMLIPMLKNQIPDFGVYFCVFLCGYYSVIAFFALLLCFSFPKQGSFIIFDYIPLKLQSFCRRENYLDLIPQREENVTNFWSDTTFGFTSNLKYPLKQEIRCELHPEKDELLNVDAKIIDIKGSNANGTYIYSAEFQNVDEKTRLYLVKHVFRLGVYRQHLRFEESLDMPEGKDKKQNIGPQRKIKYNLLVPYLGILLLGILFWAYITPIRFQARTWIEDKFFNPEKESTNLKNPVVQHYGNLKVIGTNLCDFKGNPVQLKGISSHGPQWYPFSNNNTVKNCIDLFNIDFIRIAMYADYFDGVFVNGYLAQPEYMTAKVDEMIQDAIDQGIYVIISWHVHADPTLLMSDAGKFFRRMSSKWGAYPNVIFELCNEPKGEIPWSKIRYYAIGDPKIIDDGIIDIIRKYDADTIPNLVLVGTPFWCQWVHQALEAPIKEYKNVMYTFHFYTGSHKLKIRESVETAIKGGLPVFVSEWGTSGSTGDGPLNLHDADIWFDWINKHKLSWSYWTLSNGKESSSVLKQDASLSGPWTEEDLSPSGLYLKEITNRSDPE